MYCASAAGPSEAGPSETKHINHIVHAAALSEKVI